MLTGDRELSSHEILVKRLNTVCLLAKQSECPEPLSRATEAGACKSPCLDHQEAMVMTQQLVTCTQLCLAYTVV